MIHKYLAGLIDQYELAGNAQAIEVAARLADWVCWRTGRRPMPTCSGSWSSSTAASPRRWPTCTGSPASDRYLVTAQRFDDAAVLDPLAAGQDRLSGLHANMTVPKIIASVRHVGGDRQRPLP